MNIKDYIQGISNIEIPRWEIDLDQSHFTGLNDHVAATAGFHFLNEILVPNSVYYMFNYIFFSFIGEYVMLDVCSWRQNGNTSQMLLSQLHNIQVQVYTRCSWVSIKHVLHELYSEKHTVSTVGILITCSRMTHSESPNSFADATHSSLLLRSRHFINIH